MSSQNNNFTAYFNAFNFPLLVFSPLFLSYFNSMTSFQPKSERPNNSTLMSCYERRFNLNLDFIKEKYRKQINQVLSFSEVLKATIKLEKKVEK